jgi:nucleoid DNA-binding protein
MAISKSDLAKKVASSMEISGNDARDAVNAVLNAVVESLVDGNDVRVQGFGTLKVTKCNARLGRNPSTGEAVPIPEFNTVRFKVADALKEALPEVA